MLWSDLFSFSVSISREVAVSLSILVIPMTVTIIYSDLKMLRIPNQAVLAVAIGFCFAAAIHLDLTEVWAAVLGSLCILFVGFIWYSIGSVGAGDVKLISVSALMVPAHDLPIFLGLISASLISGWFTVRLLSLIPAVVNLAPDWLCWRLAPFPLGFPLAFSLAIYLVLAAF